MKTVIGLDYGTQSARAVLVNTENGEVLAGHTVRYPHGVMEGALASIRDYEDAFMELLTAVTPRQYRDTIAAICVDATSLTLVPLNKDGEVLANLPEYAEREHAQIKLWKRHAAQPQADEALRLAREMDEPIIRRTGGEISSEWMLPKVMEIRDKDPELYGQMDLAMDLSEFLTYKLTGEVIRGAGPMSFKCSWARDLGLPSEKYLNALRPGFAQEYYHLLRGPVTRPGEKIGLLKPELKEALGIFQDVVIATPAIDGHTALVALGALQDGDLALVLGTSNAITPQTTVLCEIDGISGIAMDGLTSGLYGIDCGQNCTGDMLEWYMTNALPASVAKEAEQRGVSVHQVLMERVKNPWENRVTAVDWFNGSRNAPCDLSLRGNIAGLSLETKPEDIYLALLQGIVCGTREVLELCKAHGVTISRVVMTGGIAGKNPLLVQQYADILHMPIHVGQVSEGPAMGSAIFAAVAAGLYENPVAAYERMGVHDFVTYGPDAVHSDEYEQLFQRNHKLRMTLMESGCGRI